MFVPAPPMTPRRTSPYGSRHEASARPGMHAADVAALAASTGLRRTGAVPRGLHRPGPHRPAPLTCPSVPLNSFGELGTGRWGRAGPAGPQPEEYLMDHTIRVTPWTASRAAGFDWTCTCGRRASSPSANRAAAESDALRRAQAEHGQPRAADPPPPPAPQPERTDHVRTEDPRSSSTSPTRPCERPPPSPGARPTPAYSQGRHNETQDHAAASAGGPRSPAAPPSPRTYLPRTRRPPMSEPKLTFGAARDRPPGIARDPPCSRRHREPARHRPRHRPHPRPSPQEGQPRQVGTPRGARTRPGTPGRPGVPDHP